MLFNFLKGFLPVYYYLFELDYNHLIMIACGILILHNWNIWAKFENRKNFWFILLGIYVAISPLLGIWYILGIIGFALLWNSFLIGLVSAIVIITLPIWIIQENTYILIINIFIFIIVTFALLDDMLLQKKSIKVKRI